MERIKVLRERLGLNQIEFAEALGVTRATVSRWERKDVKRMSASASLLIETVFNVSPAWLDGENVPMFITDKTSDDAPKVTPYAFFLSQGFGKLTSRTFALFCNEGQEIKESLENALAERNGKTLESIIKFLHALVLVSRELEKFQEKTQGKDDGEDAPDVGGEEYDGEDAPIID